MKPLFNARTTAFDADAIHATVQRALTAAGLDTRQGPMRDLTQTLQRALGGSGRAAGLTPAAQPTPPGGRFQAHTFDHTAGSRAYKLYVPAGTTEARGKPRPLLVMLHGCTQSADDFAAGTQMNRLADAHGFLVVYPEQAGQANASKCWNWFKPQDQRRGSGEPALIAALVAEVARQHQTDPQRSYVAGLSAGAAMAVVLGETYPELFAGVGAHSGLPYASAQDVASAMAAMKGGRGRASGLKHTPGARARPGRKCTQPVPVIVFHGDRDHTVQHSNGAEIVEQALEAHRRHADHAAQGAGAALGVSTHTGQAPGGQRYTRTVHSDDEGLPRVESWTLHGAGHAWSGGHPSGSYTDASGPDASTEMLRFFMALPARRWVSEAARPD